MKNKKADMSLTTKSLYAIFMIIFASFVTFQVLNSRSDVLTQRDYFESYGKVNIFMEGVLYSPCLVVDFVKDKNYQSEIIGLLSSEKLNLMNKENSDISCIDNFNFMYTFTVDDLLNKKQWKIGLLNEPEWAESIVSTTLPVAVNYNLTTIHPGRATLTAYMGDIPKFYGMIKLSCVTKDERSIEINLKNKITYDNLKNKFCVDNDCYYPYFSCKVNNFTIEKGKRLVYLRYKDNELSVAK